MNGPTKVRLDRRLKAVASLVRPNKSAADIGTDHGLIPCWLYRQGTREIYACDILEKPLAAAKATMELYGIPEKNEKSSEGIALILCNGLDKVPPVDDVIIAGMGGETIADIISRCNFLNENVHFVLQPMTRDWVLRKALYQLGLYIDQEKTASAGGKVYTVMSCFYSGEKRETEEKFAFLGKNTDIEYRNKMLTALGKMGKGDKRYSELKAEIEREKKI